MWTKSNNSRASIADGRVIEFKGRSILRYSIKAENKEVDLYYEDVLPPFLNEALGPTSYVSLSSKKCWDAPQEILITDSERHQIKLDIIDAMKALGLTSVEVI